jgi:maleamate amidohydrolase
MPIIFTSVQYDEQDLKNAGLWIKKIKGNEGLLVGTPSVEIDTRLGVKKNEHILIKKYASCFFGTDLIPKLNHYRVDTLIMCGCTTSGCVRATAVDAISYGYRPIIGKEAVADRSESAHRQSLEDLSLKYADVVSVEKIKVYLESLQTK